MKIFIVNQVCSDAEGCLHKPIKAFETKQKAEKFAEKYHILEQKIIAFTEELHKKLESLPNLEDSKYDHIFNLFIKYKEFDGWYEHHKPAISELELDLSII
jgi:hypothetical protein